MLRSELRNEAKIKSAYVFIERHRFRAAAARRMHPAGAFRYTARTPIGRIGDIRATHVAGTLSPPLIPMRAYTVDRDGVL